MTDFDKIQSIFKSHTARAIFISQRKSYSVAAIDRMKFNIAPSAIDPRELVASVETYVHAMGEERIYLHHEFPKTWWDAFKIQYFPNWLLNRYPPKIETIHIDQPVYAAVCPHLQSDDKSFHLSFMAKEEKHFDSPYYDPGPIIPGELPGARIFRRIKWWRHSDTLTLSRTEFDQLAEYVTQKTNQITPIKLSIGSHVIVGGTTVIIRGTEP